MKLNSSALKRGKTEEFCHKQEIP